MSGESLAVAREGARWYYGDKVVAALGSFFCFPAGLLFLLGFLGWGSEGESPGLMLAVAIGILFAGTLLLLFFISRHRLTIFEDRIVLPEAIPPKSASVFFRNLKTLRLREIGGLWDCSLETLDGRKVSFRLSGLDFPGRARQMLLSVAESLAERART